MFIARSLCASLLFSWDREEENDGDGTDAVLLASEGGYDSLPLPSSFGSKNHFHFLQTFSFSPTPGSRFAGLERIKRREEAKNGKKSKMLTSFEDKQVHYSTYVLYSSL